jgi:hypothetical protein
MSNPGSALLISVVITSFAATMAMAQTSDDKLQTKICKLKTKTMGCAVEEGLAGVVAAVRGDAVAAGGPLPGKCEIDSPGIAPVVSEDVVTGVTCDDPSLADTGDIMISLCKTAASGARANCKATCSKLDKIDASTGDPLPEIPCHYVVDRTIVTTEPENLGFGVRQTVNGLEEGCVLTCTASIVCVCDP